MVITQSKHYTGSVLLTPFDITLYSGTHCWPLSAQVLKCTSPWHTVSKTWTLNGKCVSLFSTPVIIIRNALLSDKYSVTRKRKRFWFLRQSTPPREIDRLKLPFVDLYISVLTPWPHSSDANLEFVKNATLMFLCCVYTESSAKRARCVPGAAGASLMYKLYSNGARTELCGTLAATYPGEESSPSTETLNFLLLKMQQSA
jgi:hypothetical protein